MLKQDISFKSMCPNYKLAFIASLTRFVCLDRSYHYKSSLLNCLSFVVIVFKFYHSTYTLMQGSSAICKNHNLYVANH